jgi:hypothetical protein
MLEAALAVLNGLRPQPRRSSGRVDKGMSDRSEGLLEVLVACLFLLLSVDAMRQDNGLAAIAAALAGLLLAIWGDILIARGIRQDDREGR